MSGVLSPFASKKPAVGRVDQGVDVTQSTPFRAIAAGVIDYIDPNFYKGTPAVYEKLDTPITVSGRTYDQVYYSETPALVAVGQRVAAGDPVSSGGSAELGFAAGDLPAAHNDWSPAKDAANYQTQPGKDFLAAVSGGGGGGGILGTVEKVGETGASVLTLGAANIAGMPGGYLDSVGGAIVGGAQHVPGVVQTENLFNDLSPVKWVKDLTSWLSHEAAVGFLYFALTLIAFGLLVLALKRATGGSVGGGAGKLALAGAVA